MDWDWLTLLWVAFGAVALYGIAWWFISAGESRRRGTVEMPGGETIFPTAPDRD
jgi:hypothetical protein